MEMTNFNNSELVELNFNEMVLVDGGYSWAEFKSDCAAVGNAISNAASSFADGFSSGFASGHAAAMK